MDLEVINNLGYFEVIEISVWIGICIFLNALPFAETYTFLPLTLYKALTDTGHGRIAFRIATLLYYILFQI